MIIGKFDPLPENIFPKTLKQAWNVTWDDVSRTASGIEPIRINKQKQGTVHLDGMPLQLNTYHGTYEYFVSYIGNWEGYPSRLC